PTVQSLEACIEQEGDDDTNLLITAGPLLNTQAQVIGAVLTLTDITERKKAEILLKRQAEELAHKNADLERFAFAVSHDLQEPLRIVAAYTQLLTRKYRDAADAETEQFSRYILAGVERMRALLKDLLSYSQVIHDSDRQYPKTDMNAVLDAVMTTCEVLIRESGAVITTDLLPSACADETQLAEVLQNLLTNAIRYSDKKPPRIHISAHSGDEHHTFFVRDNGIGIPPRYYDLVFGLFKRLHSKEVPGTGIGLALCKRIVELHGGRIWVESEVGAGSTFFFTLPASRASSANAQ
ncbi:MAG: sensor histidine kinase, partial [Bryobacteraceae bacterium]